MTQNADHILCIMSKWTDYSHNTVSTENI